MKAHMKILQVVPAPNTAITTLAKQIIRHNPDVEFRLCTFHPKRPDKHEIREIEKHWMSSDLIDVQYWKSGAKIREMFPQYWPKKKKILTHYNPYNLHEEKWNDYLVKIVVNSFQQAKLPEARMVPLSIDLDFFTFQNNYTQEPLVNMTVNRIEGKKGVIEIAQACKELNYKFVLVGRVSDGGYMQRIKNVGGNFEFLDGISDEDLRKTYHRSALHVCNSVDNFESGTMPILEAMSCGIPVMTRLVGHVPDIYSESDPNLHLYRGSCEDVPAIKESLQAIMGDFDKRVSLRMKAAETVKTRSDKVRAATYRTIYEEVTK